MTVALSRPRSHGVDVCWSSPGCRGDDPRHGAL